MKDLESVGGKNASLGEMISQLSGLGVEVPGGFATTAHAFREFLAQSGLDQRINQRLGSLNVDDVTELARAGRDIRQWVMETPFQAPLEEAINSAWSTLCEHAGSDPSVAVRSSATAEDLPDASFAGQQETFLNVRGLETVRARIHEVFASLYNDRAIAYRVHQGFEHGGVALSAGIQIMVRSDRGASGVIFTIDTESGFSEAILITSSWGLGETVVQGAVNPDEFYVYKPALESGHDPLLRRNRGRA
jgi:pyruvate,water dikinase